MLIKLIVALYWHIVPIIELPKKYFDFLYLCFYGVETKFGYVTLIGLPYIKKHKNARIILGKGVLLVSKNKGNCAGINHPVNLAAINMDSILEIIGPFGASGSAIVAGKRITIESNASIGANSHVYGTDFHPIGSSKGIITKNENIHIGKNTWIGANCIILKGVNISDNCVIGAGSIVTKNIQANSIYAGNPAKFIRLIEK